SASSSVNSTVLFVGASFKSETASLYCKSLLKRQSIYLYAKSLLSEFLFTSIVLKLAYVADSGTTYSQFSLFFSLKFTPKSATTATEISPALNIFVKSEDFVYVFTIFGFNSSKASNAAFPLSDVISTPL